MSTSRSRLVARDALFAALFVLGAALILAGIWQWSQPAAYIAAGIGALLIAQAVVGENDAA